MSTLPTFTPVPRRQRSDGWSPARQAAFIQALEVCGSVAAAAETVGMDEGSAYRLRRHPEAEGFRRAWAVAQARVWQRVEQVALERVIHGELETIERDGQVVMTRRRPCSDRLMIHMLKQQVERLEREAAARTAAQEAADTAPRWMAEERRPQPPLSAEAEETRALHELQAEVAALPDSHGWDARTLALTIDHDGPVPPLPSPPKTLRPDDGVLAARSGKARLRDPAGPRNGQPRNAQPRNVQPQKAAPQGTAPRKARESLLSTGLSPEPEVIRAGAGHNFVPRPYDPGVGLSPQWPLNANWPPAGQPKASPRESGPRNADAFNPS
jgi:hypothetical protein